MRNWKASDTNVRECVIFDVDGVLCDNSERLKKLDRSNPDWGAFYETIHEDPTYPGWAALARTAYYGGYYTILLTNRWVSKREQTEQWLTAHSLPYDRLLMRDGTHYNESKRLHLGDLLREFRVLYAVDDDPLHGQMYAEAGVPFVYAWSGYYDMGRIDDSHLLAPHNSQGEADLGLRSG